MNKYPLNYISYSQLSSYVRCPFCFHETYILKNRTPATKYTSAGIAFHSFAEKYKEGMDADKLLLDEFLSAQDGYQDKEEAREMYGKMVKGKNNYLSSEYAKKEALFTELKFNTPIFKDEPNLFGFIDRIDGILGKPETYEVTDFKTSGSTKKKEELGTDFQMPIYAGVMHKMYGQYPARITYYYPVIDKYQTAIHLGDGNYRYENQRSPVVEFNVNEQLVRAYEVIQQIKSGDFSRKASHFFCHPECRAGANGWLTI